MDAARMIDFHSPFSEVVLNPRLPRGEEERLARIHAAMPSLPGHLWMTTSGSSGPLKLVALPKAAIIASAEAVNRHLNATPEDVWCAALPPFHVGGLGIHARALRSGARTVPFDRWDPQAFTGLVAAREVTLTSLVPAQVRDLVDAGLEAPPSIRAIIVGGGALADGLYFEATALGWPLLPSYGMTETCSQIATASLASLLDEGMPGLELLDHVEVKTVDGRLAVRGPSLFTGYGVEEGGRPRFVDPRHDGWFLSEDHVEIVEREGKTFLRPLGRSSDFLKIGGESVSLPRLEAILEEVAAPMEGVDAALLPVRDQRLGQVIHLVVTRPDAAEPMRDAFAERVLPFERPRRTHVVDAIPRSPLGKIQREELARLCGVVQG